MINVVINAVIMRVIKDTLDGKEGSQPANELTPINDN